MLESQQCGPNASFNGFGCACDDGYNMINSRCQKCPPDTSFDGVQCVLTGAVTQC